MPNNRVLAYSMLVHDALNALWSDKTGCCPNCCARCHAIQLLDDEGVLDLVVLEWHEYADGSAVFHEDHPPWFVQGRVDRAWLYNQWLIGRDMECH